MSTPITTWYHHLIVTLHTLQGPPTVFYGDCTHLTTSSTYHLIQRQLMFPPSHTAPFPKDSTLHTLHPFQRTLHFTQPFPKDSTLHPFQRTLHFTQPFPKDSTLHTTLTKRLYTSHNPYQRTLHFTHPFSKDATLHTTRSKGLYTSHNPFQRTLHFAQPLPKDSTLHRTLSKGLYTSQNPFQRTLHFTQPFPTGSLSVSGRSNSFSKRFLTLLHRTSLLSTPSAGASRQKRIPLQDTRVPAVLKLAAICTASTPSPHADPLSAVP